MNDITIVYIATTLLTILGAARLIVLEYRGLVRIVSGNGATSRKRVDRGQGRRPTASSRTKGRV